MSFVWSSWPPTLSDEQLSLLQRKAATWALAHGLLYLPPGFSPSQMPESAIHAPFALLPSPFPRQLFRQAQRIQSIYNVLYARIAMDWTFLDRVMGDVGTVDDFVGKLWRGWTELRDSRGQDLQLGLFRSDYLLHEEPDKLSVSLKQVEFNTISSSFGPLSERAAGLHRYLCKYTNDYFGSSSLLAGDNFPSNETTQGLAQGLAAAHGAYGSPDAKILFVVQPGERNLFDQQWLEDSLLEKHDIHVVRMTFEQLATLAHVDPGSSRLYVNITTEVSTIYYRAGYTPSDYPSLREYETRFLLERSRAIKCPSIPLQLAGAKKVQQVLCDPEVLESFLSDRDQAEIDELRGTWMSMWGLEDDSGVQRARAEHRSLVLKPQREGGGNNVYKDDIPSFLDHLSSQERKAWIAMALIRTPQALGGYLVRAGGGEIVRAEVISELGIFGWALFGSGNIEEKEVGWLVRTKGKDNNEGGVASGFSVLDSVVLA